MNKSRLVIAMLRGNWFLIGLLAAVLIGIVGHAPLSNIAAADGLQTTLVFAVMWMMAAPVPLDLVTRTLARPWAGLLAALINMGFLPLLAMLVAPWLEQDFSGGLLVAAAVPSTLASAAVWTRKAGGDDTVAIFVTLLTNLGCVVVTPLWLVGLLGVRVELDLWGLIQNLSLIVVLPIAIAQVMRSSRRFCEAALRSKVLLATLCQIGILLMVLLGSVRMGERLAEEGPAPAIELTQILLLIVLASGVHVTALVVAWYVAGAFRIERPQRIAVSLSGSQKTLMVGLKLAIDCGVSILPMVVFHVSQLLIDALIAQWWGRAGAAAVKSSPSQPPARPIA